MFGQSALYPPAAQENTHRYYQLPAHKSIYFVIHDMSQYLKGH